MIIDCFLFLNEYDMLEGRLEYLYNHVDWFVIIESNTTFSGQSKPLNYLKHVSRYKKYSDKIFYFPFHQDNLSSYNLTYKPTNKDLNSDFWKLEYNQRNHILQALKFFPDDAIVMLGDLDEIPEKNWIHFANQLLSSGKEQILSGIFKVFVYNFDNFSDFNWLGTVITKNKIISDHKSVQHFRDYRSKFQVCWDAGYHLTYWNTPENISYKIQSFAHQEYNNQEYTDIGKIKERITQGKDLFDRQQYIKLPYEQINQEIYNIFSNVSKI